MRENRAEYVVTYYGRPVAVLLPMDEAWLEEETRHVAEAARPGEDVRAELEALRQEIDQSWQSEKTAVEQVSEQRRQRTRSRHSRFTNRITVKRGLLLNRVSAEVCRSGSGRSLAST